MLAGLISRPTGLLGKKLTLGLFLGQGVAVYGLAGGDALLCGSAAAGVIALSALVARMSWHQSDEGARQGAQATAHDRIIGQFFYVLKSDRAGRVIEANERYLARMGYTSQELSELHDRCEQPYRSSAALSAEMWSEIRAGRTWSGEVCDQAKDGSHVWMSAIVLPNYDADGNLVSLTTIGVDVTDKRRAQEALKEANSRLEAFVKHAPAAVAMFDNDMRYVAHTDRWLADYNIDDVSLIGRSHYDVFPEIPEHWKIKHRRILAGATERSEEERFLRADGRENVIRWEVRPWYLPDGAIGGMMMMTEEISERNKIRDKLWRLANLDALTSLPNRLSFGELLQNEIQFSKAAQGQFSVALLDVDRFKEINDTLGHDVGDQLLKQLASRIQAALDGCGTIARLSGDEFAILVRGDEGLAAAAFDTVQSALEEPLAIGDTQRTCTASIGATKFPEDATEAGDLLKNADLALYRAKSLGRDRIVQFEPSMRSAMGRKVELQQEAREALRHGQFRLHYQPIVPASTAQPLSFEALLRWQHPNHGLLAPGSFEEVLEDPRLAMTIGDAVIDMALAQAAQWLSEGKEFGRIAVNVTSADFSFGDFAGRLNEKLDHHRVPASKLCIEVTERVFLGVGATHVAEALQRISALGVEVALDDFGTGYASLTHLKAFPIDRLKVDRSFVMDMHENNDSLSIVQAIVQLGQSVGLRVTAEGVEKYEQLALLQSMGCGSFQGYYFSPPRPVEEISMLFGGNLNGERAIA